MGVIKINKDQNVAPPKINSRVCLCELMFTSFPLPNISICFHLICQTHFCGFQIFSLRLEEVNIYKIFYRYGLVYRLCSLACGISILHIWNRRHIIINNILLFWVFLWYMTVIFDLLIVLNEFLFGKLCNHVPFLHYVCLSYKEPAYCQWL